MKKPIILVTGSEVQLGNALKRHADRFSDFDFLFIDKNDVDLTDETDFIDFANEYQVKFLINCAAYTAVDLAEKEREIAQIVNADVPFMLARYCKQRNIRLIHISTDYIFDGAGNSPLTESSRTNPLSVYGSTKLEGERRVLEALSDAYVIRTSWVYSIFGKNFLKTMVNLGKQREELQVVFDQVGSPTCAGDLAEAILTIIQCIEAGEDFPGIYNYSNEGVISWYDFAVEIMKKANLSCKIIPIRTSEYPTAATRPVFSVLDKAKIKTVFGLTISHWSTSLEKTIKELQS